MELHVPDIEYYCCNTVASRFLLPNSKFQIAHCIQSRDYSIRMAESHVLYVIRNNSSLCMSNTVITSVITVYNQDAKWCNHSTYDR